MAIKAVAALKLATEDHLKPYHLGCIKNDDTVKVSKTCMVLLSIGNSYSRQIGCDAIGMDVLISFSDIHGSVIQMQHIEADLTNG